MAAYKFAEMAAMVATKVAEMEERLDTLLKSDASENTKRTQKFQRQTAIHNMKVLQAVLETSPENKIVLTMDQEKWFTSMITLSEERKRSVVEVHEGDSVIELAFNRYKGVADVVAKINKAAEKAGLRIVDGIVIK